MAFLATHSAVYTNQRKAVLFMDLGYVINKPGFCIVTPGTIIANGHAMYILMTGSTLRWCLLKDKRGMASFAIGLIVRTLQLKIGVTMIELQGGIIHRPARRIVTYGTINFKPLPVRRLSHCGQKSNDKYYY
jgi:hypothetical protein